MAGQIEEMDDGDGLMTFVDAHPGDEEADGQCWRILVVDDDADVHQVTQIALKGITIESRKLEFVHAYSAAEARTKLQEFPDVAVILLDVVMESPDAGLQLVRHIRDELNNAAIRIILRTGQPGFAPEIDTIQRYDINDYKTKSELTRIRLFTSLTVAVRSYWQIHRLEVSRRGLELIVDASTELSKLSGLRRFAHGVVTQLCALLDLPEEGLVCAVSESTDKGPYVIAAAGRYSEWIGQPLADIPDPRVRVHLERGLAARRHQFAETACLYFSVPNECSIVVFVDIDRHLGDLDLNLLKVFCSNITVAFENLQLYQRVSTLAFEDTLLGLPNRNGFLPLLENRCDECDRLAVVDIDDFAHINSILDQDFGDLVLNAVSQRLRQSFSGAVVLARVGSDVFGLLGPHSEITPEQIVRVFAQPFVVFGESLRLSATSGLVVLDDRTVKGAELLKNASVALKLAKHFNRGKAVFFEKTHAVEARDRMQMLNRLRVAFSADRLFLVYQPFIDLSSGRIVGAEALLRWRNEQGEYTPPDRFIPLAEQSGLMVPIGEWLMRAAFGFLKRLQTPTPFPFRMAINVSHVQFREPDFVEKLLQAIYDCEVDPGHVELELTESVAIENIAVIEQKLAALRAAGVAVAIDDFGTGYSSLSILHQLKVDRLKIDKSFVSGEEAVQGDFSIAEMIIKLAEQLGIETIAEGVETQEQCDRLRAMGCQDGQGYLFSRPLMADDFERLLGGS